MTPPPPPTARPTNWLSAALLLALAGGLISSLFFKERWLWMDEVISYVLLTDPSWAHANHALVSSLEANPPLSLNVYWLLGHGLSLAPLFLRSVSILFFALTVVLFYRYATRLLGRPVSSFVVVTLFVCFTYLNFTLSTQVRSYAFFGLVHLLFFINSHQLALSPGRARLLLAHLLLGTALVFAHNFGLLYAATMGAFFLLLTLWSGRRAYWRVLAVEGLVALIWLLAWYPKFRLQAQAGQPHSWIPLPTPGSFFRTVGELLPTLSSHLEASPTFQLLPPLRVAIMAGLIAYGCWPRLRRGYAALAQDPAGLFCVQASFVALATIGLALGASFTVTSVFLSRYLWPNHLLFAFVALYTYQQLVPEFRLSGGVGKAARWALPAYAALLLPFVANQNRKATLFSSGILRYLPALNPQYPLFFESADYFLPIWFQHLRPNTYFLLDWPAALRSPALSSTVDYRIIESLRDHYHEPQVVALSEFSGARFPHFYVVDQQSHYQIEEFLASGRVRVLRVLPTAIAGHRILECVAVGAGPLAAVPTARAPLIR